MKIGIDLRPVQTSSRHRGIGNYVRDLASHLLKLDHDNDYLLFVDADLEKPALTDRDDELFWDDFREGIPRTIPIHPQRQRDENERFKFTSLAQVSLLQSEVDLYHVTNPFDWDSYVSYRYDFCPSVVTVYDLIPLVLYDQYLTPQSVDYQEEFAERLRPIVAADRVLAISECTKNDITNWLGIPETRIDVVYPGAKEQFRVIEDRRFVKATQKKFGIRDDYVLCVLGYHYTKNLNGAMESFSRMAEAHRRRTQLAIVCRLLPDEERALMDIARQLAIDDRVVLTNQVADSELLALYNGATTLLYPSLYDGFGLPVLEAMKCGLPVITSNVASLPEVAGEAAILVNPHDVQETAEALDSVLEDGELRAQMREKGLKQADKFSWERAALETIAAYGKAAETRQKATLAETGASLRLAYFSPINPQRSGISDYSELLLPHLANHAEIDIYVDGYQPSSEAITDRFRTYDYRAFDRISEHRDYDLIVYQMGNSAFHEYMYQTLLSHPGAVVLHDFVLHGFLRHITFLRGEKDRYLAEIEYCEGEQARVQTEAQLAEGITDVFTYPLNRRVVEASKGIVVHSDWAKKKLEEYERHPPVARIPHGVTIEPLAPRLLHSLRTRLRLHRDLFLVGCFGRIAGAKRLDTVLRAFARFTRTRPRSFLLLVGELSPDLEESLPCLIDELGLRYRTRITGHVEWETFQDYMRVSDLFINLRYPTAGETSGTLIRLLGTGKPGLISSLPQNEEIPDDCCWKVDVDDAEEDLLLAYMVELADNESLRDKMGENARRYVAEQGYSWESVARAYMQFIERLISSRR
jgi:glycosyltransferase involved in cell wall biosynthesis